MNLGSKMVLDAQSAPGAAPPPAPPPAPPDPRALASGIRGSRLAWGAMLVVQVEGEGRAVIERLVQRPELAALKLIVAVSADVPLDDDQLLLWGIFTRFDCARDIVPARTETRGAWLTCHGPLGIDATWKAGYPETVGTPPAVAAAVDGWWGRG
jgi:3-polyprenyl-4-hydroxybenzoate decarboxylase